MGQRHYEEFEVGDSFDLSSRTITEAEIRFVDIALVSRRNGE